MSVFIELTTDAFQARFDERKNEKKKQRRGAGAADVRRPLRGLEIKDDTHAILKVVTSDGQEIKLVNSSSEDGKSTEFANFILQSVQEARMEKHQIVETFGESYIYFFGEAPRFLDVSAVLVDSLDFNWAAEFWENYERFFRGTRLVEMGARTYMFYEDTIVEGYMLNATAVKTSETPLMVQLQFRLFLTNYSNISIIGDPSFPIRGSLIIPDEVGDVNKLDVDRFAYLATLGANLQQAGFGGGAQFQEAFANGYQGQGGAGIPPELYGIFLNASEALGDGHKHPERFQRKVPLRTKIADNADEFTVPRPSLTTGVDEATVIQDEVENLVNQANEMLRLLGAQQNPPSLAEQNASFALQQQRLGLTPLGTNRFGQTQYGLGPTMMNQMGLGPRFGNTGYPIGMGGVGVGQQGFGPRAGVSASFGARIGASVSGGVGGGFGLRAGAGVGIGGGLGFSGRAGAGAGFGLNGGFATPYSPNAAIANNQYGYSKRSNALSQLNRNQFANQVDLNYFESYKYGPYYNPAYANGVRTGSGISLGVGIGGGIGRPFQVSTFSGPGAVPGFGAPGFGAPGFTPTTNPAFGAQQGGGFRFTYSVGDPPPSGYGYNPYGSPYVPNYGPGPANFGYPGAPPGATFGGPGNGGASVMVGGAPTAFSMVSVGGTLTPNGLQTYQQQISNF
jgi:hypothetical protein